MNPQKVFCPNGACPARGRQEHRYPQFKMNYSILVENTTRRLRRATALQVRLESLGVESKGETVALKDFVVAFGPATPWRKEFFSPTAFLLRLPFRPGPPDIVLLIREAPAPRISQFFHKVGVIDFRTLCAHPDHPSFRQRLKGNKARADPVPLILVSRPTMPRGLHWDRYQHILDPLARPFVNTDLRMLRIIGLFLREAKLILFIPMQPLLIGRFFPLVEKALLKRDGLVRLCTWEPMAQAWPGAPTKAAGKVRARDA